MKKLYGGVGKNVISFFLILALVMQTLLTSPENVSADSLVIEIEGYQINTVRGAFRTVYSVDSSVEVSELGLIYGIDGKTTDAEMFVGSDNPTVYSFSATSKGYMGTSKGKDVYVMTMDYKEGTRFITTSLLIKPYIKYADGRYAYGTTEKTSVYDIADELYKNS